MRSCKNEVDLRPGEGICGEPSAAANSSLSLQSHSSESDRCAHIGVLNQPVEYPVVAVATRRFLLSLTTAEYVLSSWAVATMMEHQDGVQMLHLKSSA